MSVDLAAHPVPLAGGFAVVWAAAAVVAGALPSAGSARLLRRRTVLLLCLVASSAAAAGGLALAPAPEGAVPDALAVLAVAALGSAVACAPRLRRLAAAAGVFAHAPDIPASPALRAMAAHPLVATPLHAATAAALLILASASGAWRPGFLTGATLLALVTAASGVAHAVRHDRLAEPALLPVRTVRPAPASLFTAGGAH